MKTIQENQYSQLGNLEKSLYNEPINNKSIFGGYTGDNMPEGSIDTLNAHSNQIMNKAASTLYRMADFMWGQFMPDEARENMLLDLEQMREDYIETENNINKYLYTEANAAEIVALGIGGQLYRGIADPVNAAMNYATMGASGLSGFFINFMGDMTQYAADTSFFENRNIFTDPKLQDVANLGLSGGISLGTMKMQNKFSVPGESFLYNETGKLKKTNLQWENPRMEDKYLVDVNNPNEFMPRKATEIAPLDRLLMTNQENPELLKAMQERGYNTLVDTKSMSQVAIRQVYGQPQANYKDYGIRQDIHNFVNSVTEMNKKYQGELYKDEKIRNSSISTETEITHALKPLSTGIENALDFYYGVYARNLSEITGYNGATGDMIATISEGLPKELLVDGLNGRVMFGSDNQNYKLLSFLHNEFEDYRGSIGLDDEFGKAIMYEKTYAKNEHQAAVRKAYENNDIEMIKKYAQFVGKEVPLTEAEAKAVGLNFDHQKATRTIEKGQGDYRDFALEIKDLQNKVKDYARKEKEVNAKEIEKEIKSLKKDYKKKEKNIKRKLNNIGIEKNISREELSDFRKNRDTTLNTEHQNIVAEKEKINNSYKEQIKGISSERDTKIKDIKSKIAEIRKQETSELNKIQKDGKLYDPNKLPFARRIQRKNSKSIRKLKNEISDITKEYDKKISDLEKKQGTEIEVLNKKEKDLQKTFSKGTDKYSKISKENIKKISKETNKDIEKELKKLQEEYSKSEAEIIKKYKDKKYNKYKIMQSELKKVNEKNYKKFYKKFSKYEKDFKEIKDLDNLAKTNGRYVLTNTYSIHDNPIEVTRAFYNDMARTNTEAIKRINIGGKEMALESLNIQKASDYRNIYYIAEKWGNKTVTETFDNGKLEAYNVSPVDNFIKSAFGNEKETYEIITGILSDNAEQKSGMNDVRQLLSNLTVNDGKYSKDFNLSEQFGMTSLTTENRRYAIEALNNMLNKNTAARRIGPDYWLDPKKQAINTNMVRRAFKGLMSIKFLGNLNYLREIPQNNFRIVSGARKLGWNKKYNIIQDFTDGIKTTYQLAKNFDNLKNNTLENISDPIVKRRAKLWIDRRLANSIVYNEVDGVKMNFIQKVSQGIDSAANKMAAGQSVSDVQRISGAEFATINYMLDILPEANSPLLNKILKNNGIEEADFNILNNRIKELGENGLMELAFSGKRPTNTVDYRIKSLFEQFSDVMGKEFNAYQKHNSFKETGSFLSDTMYMFKRYSLGAVDGFVTNLTTYIDNDGMIRKSFYPTGDFKINYKNMIRGVNFNNTLPFLYSSVSGSLIYNIAIKKAQGELFGGTDDEKAEAKFQSLMSIEGLLGFTTNAVKENILNVTGVGIAFGGSTVLGSAYEMSTARLQRAYTAEDLNWEEAAALWTICLFAPEPVARGIDNIKFEKNIPSRITASSQAEADAWRYDKRIDAELEQIEGKLPYEVDWLSFWKKRPKEAREFTNSPDSMPDEIVIVGAAGISGVMEETAETVAIAEQMTEDKETREKNLKAMGLDIDTLLNRMELADARNFNAVLSFMKIRDEEEILMLAYNFTKSKDKNSFLESIMSEEEMKFFNSYKDRINKNRKKINSSINTELTGMDSYIEMLNLIDSYAM